VNLESGVERVTMARANTVTLVGSMLNDLKKYLLAPVFKLDVYPKGGSYCIGLLAKLDLPELPNGYVTVFERCTSDPEVVTEFMALAETVARNVLGNLLAKDHTIQGRGM
jgi:hypothetical protein